MNNTTPRNMAGHTIGSSEKEYKLLTLLGEGGFGAVYDATKVETAGQSDDRYAVKCMKRHAPDSLRAKYQASETALHTLVSEHPNVVTLHDVLSDEESMYMVMDLCKGGDLLGPISRREFVGKDEVVKKLFLQLIDVVGFCHEKGVFHRDLKPDNVLLDGEGNMFLADFGLASSEETSKGFSCGTMQYISPECVGEISRDAYSHRTNDVWALGVILTTLLTGCFPWKMPCSLDPTWNAYQASKQWIFDAFNISTEAAQLLVDIFNVDSHARITLPDMRKRVQEMKTFFPDPNTPKKDLTNVNPKPIGMLRERNRGPVPRAKPKPAAGARVPMPQVGVGGGRPKLPQRKRPMPVASDSDC